MRIIDSAPQSAEENMLLDEKLLNELSEPLLHHYSWIRPSITYGYFVKPEEHLHLEKLKTNGIDLARRPTGGGIVFHLWDLAFSFLLPSNHPLFSLNPIDNYRFVNTIVLNTMEECFNLKAHFLTQPVPSHAFCMATPTQYDVLYEGRKIAGAAQRKKKNGYLHQGILSISPPDPALLDEVLLSKESIKNILINTFAPAPIEELSSRRKELKKLLSRKFMAIFSCVPI